MAVRIAVLASGNGTNLQAIINYNAARGASAAGAVVLVASNLATAGAIERARAASIATAVFDPNDDGSALIALLEAHETELVVLAGYMRRLPPAVIRRFPARILNIHPARLPEFGGAGMYGARVHAAVIESGASVTGVTVHLVDDELDNGPVIAQWAVPVVAGDTAESLAARVLEVEHLVYPPVIDMVASLSARGFFADF